MYHTLSYIQVKIIKLHDLHKNKDDLKNNGSHFLLTLTVEVLESLAGGTCKRRFAILPSPAGKPLTSRMGTGKSITFFYSARRNNNSGFNIKQTLGRRGEDDLTRVRAKPLPPPSGLSTSKVNMASGSLTEVTAVNRDSGRSAAVRNPPEVTEGPQAVFGVAAEKGSGSGMPGEVNTVSGMQREDCKPEVGS